MTEQTDTQDRPRRVIAAMRVKKWLAQRWRYEVWRTQVVRAKFIRAARWLVSLPVKALNALTWGMMIFSASIYDTLYLYRVKRNLPVVYSRFAWKSSRTPTTSRHRGHLR
jgi:hypothetical protein